MSNRIGMGSSAIKVCAKVVFSELMDEWIAVYMLCIVMKGL